MIRYICDTCDSHVDTRQAKLPPGWSCDPIRDIKGTYTHEMSYVCPDCMARRKGEFEEKPAAKKTESPRSRQTRAKKRKTETEGQGSLF